MKNLMEIVLKVDDRVIDITQRASDWVNSLVGLSTVAQARIALFASLSVAVTDMFLGQSKYPYLEYTTVILALVAEFGILRCASEQTANRWRYDPYTRAVRVFLFTVTASLLIRTLMRAPDEAFGQVMFLAYAYLRACDRRPSKRIEIKGRVVASATSRG